MTFLSNRETSSLSRRPGSLHRGVEPTAGLVSRCMISSKLQWPVSYRTSKFSSNRHRKSQPFRE
ncbi:hypothetical protein GE061_012996, partial [Apolygus lucorum]